MGKGLGNVYGNSKKEQTVTAARQTNESLCTFLKDPLWEEGKDNSLFESMRAT